MKLIITTFIALLALYVPSQAQSSEAKAENFEEVWVAIQNQSGLRATFVSDKSSNHRSLFLKIENLSEKSVTLAYEVNQISASTNLLSTREPIQIDSGKSILLLAKPIYVGANPDYTDLNVILNLNE